MYRIQEFDLSKNRSFKSKRYLNGFFLEIKETFMKMLFLFCFKSKRWHNITISLEISYQYIEMYPNLDWGNVACVHY